MNIYDMKLHDVLWLHLNNTEVLRVPGGWVYRVYDSGTQRECLNSCFVPFDNQFMETSESVELAATDSQQLQAKIRAIVLETELAQSGDCDAGEILTDLVADLRVLSAM